MLVVVSHPDDAEIWVGGTILNHRKCGFGVHLVYTHAGVEHRREEAIAAAALYGAVVHFLDSDPPETELASVIKAVAPSIIITHWTGDSHPEHVATGKLVMDLLPDLLVETGLKFTTYACDTYNSLGLDGVFNPSVYVDVSSVWTKKERLISCYRSQPTQYWLSMMSQQCALHGSRCGVEKAEAFVQLPMLGVLRGAQKLLREW